MSSALDYFTSPAWFVAVLSLGYLLVKFKLSQPWVAIGYGVLIQFVSMAQVGETGVNGLDSPVRILWAVFLSMIAAVSLPYIADKYNKKDMTINTAVYSWSMTMVLLSVLNLLAQQLFF